MRRLITSINLLKLEHAAQYLLGCEIWRTLDGGEVLKAKIVETESYHQDDPASHTYSGKSERNKAMFGPPGHAYVYFTYGMYWCFNVTAAPENYGAGVLIRAAEPLESIDIMKLNRYKPEQLNNYSETKILKGLMNGPAKLAKALMIDKSLYGHDLTKKPLQIIEPEKNNFEITKTTRIGISKAVDEIARFYITNNKYISRY